jgi:NAD+ kinase
VTDRIKDTIRTIGVVGRDGHDDLQRVVDRLRTFAKEKGLEIVFEETLRDVSAGIALVDLSETPTDLLVALGGDGTLLRAGRIAADRGIPVLGINLGRLGFLTASPEPEMETRLGMVLAGQFDLDRRSMLEATVVQDGRVESVRLAWNDFVLHKTGVARITLLELKVEAGTWEADLGSFSGDGLIVATPTGSTAYSLSAGGPIVTPAVDCMLLTPICPHTLAARPLVIPGDQTVSVRALEESTDLVLTVDGQANEQISAGDEIRISVSDVHVPLVRFPDQNFYSTIRQKLRWAARPDAKTF